MNAWDKLGETPLHWLAISSQDSHVGVAIAELLVEKGADVNAVHESGEAPLKLARWGRAELAEFLVMKGGRK